MFTIDASQHDDHLIKCTSCGDYLVCSKCIPPQSPVYSYDTGTLDLPNQDEEKKEGMDQEQQQDTVADNSRLIPIPPPITSVPVPPAVPSASNNTPVVGTTTIVMVQGPSHTGIVPTQC